MYCGCGAQEQQVLLLEAALSAVTQKGDKGLAFMACSLLATVVPPFCAWTLLLPGLCASHGCAACSQPEGQ